MTNTGLAAKAAQHLKFTDPDWTAKREPRATVGMERLETVWFNTGTLCNIACINCYIESSPTNDRLAYLTAAEVRAFLDEIVTDGLGTREIGFTGGEPFMNPDILDMLRDALSRGFDVLVLTNAMQPLQRPKIRRGLLGLREEFGEKLRIRVSLDHYTAELHEAERGPKTFQKTIAGINWLTSNGFRTAIAGRTCWHELEEEERSGYKRLIDEHGWAIDPADPKSLVLLPEMDGRDDIPEISTACWDILGKRAGMPVYQLFGGKQRAAAPTRCATGSDTWPPPWKYSRCAHDRASPWPPPASQNRGPWHADSSGHRNPPQSCPPAASARTSPHC